MKIRSAVAVAVATLLLLAGCLPATPQPSEPVPDAAMTITISNHAYDVSGPVGPGETIAIVNHDNVDHTVTSDDGTSFDVAAPAGQTVTFTAPDTVGVFSFHCIPHLSMVSELEVR